MHSDLEEMAGRIRNFMRRSISGEHRDGEFNRLALELFSAQREHNPPYARFCEQRNAGRVSDWKETPAAPTFAFKELELTSLRPPDRTAVFYSSGTTQRDPSRHFHSRQSLELYEESLWLWFAKQFDTKQRGRRWMFLTPNLADAPNSSLVHMFATIAQRIEGATEFLGTIDPEGAWTSDLKKVQDDLVVAQSSQAPISILGTAFQFVHLLDVLEANRTTVRLPPESWILETGGYKGRSREVPKEDLHRLISERLGVRKDRIFGEYGMSELSSQGYAGPEGLIRFPPWAQVQIVSPATGREAPEGQPGLIRIVDLANVWSVMAVQTEDIGIRQGDAFLLVGRAAQAEARGCSLMAA